MSQPQMRAVLIRNGKSQHASDLYTGNVAVPQLAANQVLVKVKAFGLNRMDVIQRQGNYPVPAGTTDVLGVEFSGTVADANETRWNVNDEVYGLVYGGAYAEYVAVDAKMVLKKPEELSWEQAAAIPENFITAFQALIVVAEMKVGAKVLIHAGASGVGITANQIAATLGAAQVFTTASSEAKLDVLRKLGSVGLNYRTEDWAQKILEATNGSGVDIVIDFVGKNHWANNIKVLGRDGRMVLLGLLSGAKTEEPLDMGPLLYKRLRIEGSTLRSRTPEYQQNLLTRFESEVLPHILGNGNKINIFLHQTSSWKQIVEATTEMEQNGNIGKIVCVVD